MITVSTEKTIIQIMCWSDNMLEPQNNYWTMYCNSNELCKMSFFNTSFSFTKKHSSHSSTTLIFFSNTSGAHAPTYWMTPVVKSLRNRTFFVNISNIEEMNRLHTRHKIIQIQLSYFRFVFKNSWLKSFSHRVASLELVKRFLNIKPSKSGKVELFQSMWRESIKIFHFFLPKVVYTNFIQITLVLHYLRFSFWCSHD